MPVERVKARFSEVVDRVVDTHDRVFITRRGREDAVLMSVDDLDALEGTLDLLSNPSAMQDIADGRVEAANGEGMNAAEVRRRYLRAKP